MGGTETWRNLRRIMRAADIICPPPAAVQRCQDSQFTHLTNQRKNESKMKTREYYVAFACTAVISVCLAACSTDKSEESKGKAPVTAGEETVSSASGTVQAINHSTRELTLKLSSGKLTTFVVDKRVQRLNEVQVGDEVVAGYYSAWVAELRPPTEDEKRHPLTVSDTTTRSPKGTEPSATNVQQTRAVTTVEDVDRANQTLTVKGPRGNYVTARAKDPKKLEKVQVGDTIVLTYTEAVAVSLDKK